MRQTMSSVLTTRMYLHVAANVCLLLPCHASIECDLWHISVAWQIDSGKRTKCYGLLRKIKSNR